MAKIISIHSYRGGTGKSNLTANLAVLARLKGVRTLSLSATRVADLGPLAGLLIAIAVWAAIWGVLELGAAPLIGLGVLFVVLTLAGNPIIFMLSIVGIVSATYTTGSSWRSRPTSSSRVICHFVCCFFGQAD